MIAITFPLAVTLGIAAPLDFTASYYHSRGNIQTSPFLLATEVKQAYIQMMEEVTEDLELNSK